MKAPAVRALIVLSVLTFIVIWTAAAQERGNDRSYGSDRKGSSISSESADDSENSRGNGRYSGRDDSQDDSMDGNADVDPQDIDSDGKGNYQFKFDWKWNGEQEVSCPIPASEIVNSEKELEKIAASRDPYQMLGIDWTKYDENERNHVFWQALYRFLYTKNASRISALTEKFSELKKKEGLSDLKFLELLLSFVQNFRYDRPGGDLDVLTQPDTLYRKFGDCDTKSLLLTTLLTGLGYDTIIYYSSYYSHAMAGVYMNGSGTYKKFNGKKYYFLETTYTGWKPGVLPPEYNNTRYWDVCVIH